MLEAFRSSHSFADDRNPKFVAPTATRPHRAVNADGLARSGSSDAIRCPQPWRPSSPTQPTKRKSKRSLFSDDREREACQEIQQILGARQTPSLVVDAVSPGGTPSIGGVPQSSYSAISSTSLAPERIMGDNADAPFMILRPSVPVARHLMFGTPSLQDNEYIIPPASDPSDINDSASNVQLHEDLTLSNEDLLGANALGLTHNENRVSVGELYEPSVTPPMRSSNPVALNSPFFYSSGAAGAEIGLLSFSPPPGDTLGLLMGERRARLPYSGASEFSTRKRFGDAAPRRGRTSSILSANSNSVSMVDSTQIRTRASQTSEVF